VTGVETATETRNKILLDELAARNTKELERWEAYEAQEKQARSDILTKIDDNFAKHLNVLPSEGSEVEVMTLVEAFKANTKQMTALVTHLESRVGIHEATLGTLIQTNTDLRALVSKLAEQSASQVNHAVENFAHHVGVFAEQAAQQGQGPAPPEIPAAEPLPDSQAGPSAAASLAGSVLTGVLNRRSNSANASQLPPNDGGRISSLPGQVPSASPQPGNGNAGSAQFEASTSASSGPSAGQPGGSTGQSGEIGARGPIGQPDNMGGDVVQDRAPADPAPAVATAQESVNPPTGSDNEYARPSVDPPAAPANAQHPMPDPPPVDENMPLPLVKHGGEFGLKGIHFNYARHRVLITPKIGIDFQPLPKVIFGLQTELRGAPHAFSPNLPNGSGTHSIYTF